MTELIATGGEGHSLLGLESETDQFQKQDTKGELAIYDPKETQNVFEVLQEVWNENGEGAYYTCFVDEYYYEENPVNKGNVRLNEFVNADDRVFTLATSLQYSKDRSSLSAGRCHRLPYTGNTGTA